jgi:iron complex transport system substrate-binding protein
MMIRTLLRATVALVAIAATSACFAAPPTIAPFKDVSRLVSIGGSLTEIIYALGEESHLVARDTTGTYPPAATALPDVGYMRALSAEGVLAVDPSAILVVHGSGPADALALLEKAGVPYVEVPDDYSGQGIVDKVLTVGSALGASDKAEALADQLTDQLNAVAAATAKVVTPKRVLFVLSAQDGKLMASGTGTAADGIIHLAGAVNATGSYPGYKLLNDEAIIAANPDAILMMDNAGDESATRAAILANPAVQLTTAGQNKAVIHMDGSYLLGFGPRTPAAVLDLVHQLYPDLKG